jgi:hypothetical protein
LVVPLVFTLVEVDELVEADELVEDDGQVEVDGQEEHDKLVEQVMVKLGFRLELD